MSISFTGSSSASTTGSQTSVTISQAGGSGDLMVLALGFEGRAAGSGPWVDTSAATPGSGIIGPATGWYQVGYQAPSATGNGLEVWAAFHGGTTAQANFTGSYSAIAAMAAYSGVIAAAIGSSVLRDSTFAQWTGDDPECPSIVAVRRELVVACAAHELQSPGYGDPTPPGWTTRVDAKRGGAFGNVEVAIADIVAAADGATGQIPFNATAETGTTKATTATLAVRAPAEVFAAGSPLVHVEYAVPT